MYRIFSNDSLFRNDSALLFLPKPLDERELLHEVAELRKKQQTLDDITFHICANMMRENEGDSIVQTIRLIRRLFPSDISHHYPTFVYGQMPSLMDSGDDTRKFVWRNLVVINNAVADFIECRLLSTVFLYSDSTQKTLSEFIFNICNSNVSYDKLSARLNVKQRELFDCEEKSSTESIDFPPIFGGFNTFGIRYPEEESRAHLRQYYIYSSLRYALQEVGDTNIEKCNEEAKRILSFLPLETTRICLQEESFLDINPNENVQRWQTAESFWNENIELQMHGLSEYPREDWFNKIRQRIDILYQGRFREIGTDFFYKLENKKIDDYCDILKNLIVQEFEKSILSKPLSLEAQKNIIRVIVNVLQTKVIEIQNLKTTTESEIDNIEREIHEITEKWNALGIFSRLRGKDNQVLALYRDTIKRLMIKKCLLPGCDFAIMLLNELIPEVSVIIESCERRQRIINDALRSLEAMVNNSNPSELYGIFGNKDLLEARLAIEADDENLCKDYLNILRLLLDTRIHIEDGDRLIATIRAELGDSVNEYLDKRIEECTIPPLLGISIVDRIERVTTAIGGFNSYIENIKRKTNISVSIKKNCQISSKYILIAPKMTVKLENVEHLVSDDFSQIQLMNIKYGLTLQDLDGFTGQRMFVEPSIF